VILITGWIIAARLSNSIVKPLLTLADATDRISRRKFNEKIEIHTGDETEALASSFNKMQKDLEKTTVKKEFFENIINSLLESLLVVSEQGIIETVNVATYMILEYEEHELIGKPIETILADGTFKDLLKEGDLKSLVIKNQLSKAECFYKTKHGDEIPVHFSGSIIHEAFGDTDGVACIGIDLRKQREVEAEKKQLEGQLLQSQKMEAIGTLTGGIAHDFNNIIGTMLGFISLLAGKATDADDKEYLEILQSSGERAAGLVSQMLAFSRANHAELQPVGIAVLVKEILKMMRAVTPATIQIKQTIEANGVLVMANSTQINLVVMNLCNNSIHAMKNTGGELEVSLSLINDSQRVPHDLKANEKGFVKLSVNDTGVGMPSEIKDRVFDPFFTTKEVGEGTGLGMSVVHGIVNKHEGSIIINSKPGEGTKIDIYLPVSEEKATQPPDQLTFKPESQSQHIMIVEDEKSLAKFYQIALNKLGYKTTVFNDPKEALADYESNTKTYDLVYTDQTMPNISGLELSRKLLSVSPSLPIILVSGHHAADLQNEAKISGIRGILMKPVSIKKLSFMLNDIFSKQSSA
jgi:PAS domain S-box-containing protein